MINNRTQLIIGMLAVLVLFGAGCFSGEQSNTQPQAQDGAPTRGVAVGDRAPDFSLETFNGEEVRLSELRGQPVVIDFWAAWCPFCVEEMEVLQTAHEQNKDVVFLGIHRTNTEDVSTAESFAEERDVTYRLLKDASGDVYQTYAGGGSFMPIAYFIDADGVIQKRFFGPKTESQIKQALELIK
jgi:peroxiredoxin